MGIAVGVCASAVFVLTLVTLFTCIAYKRRLKKVNKFDPSRPSARENAEEYASIDDLMPPSVTNPSTVIPMESNLAYTSCKEVSCGASLECKSTSDEPKSEGNVFYDEICDCSAQACNCQKDKEVPESTVNVPCDTIVGKEVRSHCENEANLCSKSIVTPDSTMNMVDNLAYACSDGVNARPKVLLLSDATTRGYPNKIDLDRYEKTCGKMTNHSLTSPTDTSMHSYDRNHRRLVTASHSNNHCLLYHPTTHASAEKQHAIEIETANVTLFTAADS